MSQLFLPERHPVRDFFVLDALDVAPRSDMASMEHPIFSLSSKPETRPLKYTHGENSIEIIPSVLGLPTVFDKDVLIYCISKLVDMQNNGRNIGPSIRLTTHDLLVQTNRPTNNLGYERVAPALDRLKGVTIKTNIKTGDSITTRGFGLIGGRWIAGSTNWRASTAASRTTGGSQSRSCRRNRGPIRLRRSSRFTSVI
jgi:plasmid replication initiation protein